MNRLDVLLVNDHFTILQGLKAIFNSEKDINVIAEAHDVEMAVAKAMEAHPAIVVMGLSSDNDCLDACQRICGFDASIKILVLSPIHEEDKVLNFLKAGISSYTLKGLMAIDLVSAIRLVALGQVLIPNDVAAKIFSQLEVNRKYYGGLTLREIEVLQCIASGLSNKEIAVALRVSDTTVKTHVSNILKKLNVTNRTSAVLYACSRRWIDPDYFSIDALKSDTTEC